jgi:MATE family multidrug resistance protein
MLLAPEPVAALYTTDADIRGLAITLVKLAGLFVIMDALQVSAAFSLRAFKDTLQPFLFMVAGYWLLALPLGYWLGMLRTGDTTEGTIGFWWGMIAGIAVVAAMVCIRLYRFLQRPLPKLSKQELDELELLG